MIPSSCIPENIRRLMPSEDRKEMKAPTQSEADQKFIHRAEKKLQENLIRLLEIRNITVFRQRMDRKATGLPIGWPDLTFAVNGRACAVECKTMDGRLTREQKDVLEKLSAEGWRTWIARSEADFLAWLKTVQADAAADDNYAKLAKWNLERIRRQAGLKSVEVDK